MSGRGDRDNFVGPDRTGMQNRVVEWSLDEAKRKCMVTQTGFDLLGVGNRQVDCDLRVAGVKLRNHIRHEIHADRRACAYLHMPSAETRYFPQFPLRRVGERENLLGIAE